MNTISRIVYDYMKRNIIISTIILCLPVIYFPILKNYGSQLKLSTENYALTPLGNNVTICVVLISIFACLYKTIGDKFDGVTKKIGVEILEDVLDSSSYGRQIKKQYYEQFISDEKQQSICEHMSPMSQLEKVINRHNETIANLIGVKPAETGVFVIFRFSDTERYSYYSSDAMKPIISLLRDDSYNDLIVSDVIDGQMQKMIADARNVIKLKKYFGDNVGSFYSKNISISLSNEKKIECYLTVITKNYQISSDDDIDTKRKFENVIIPILDLQVNIEVEKIYIYKLEKCPHRNKKP